MKALPLVQPAGKRKKPISRGALATISIFLGAPIVPLLADTPFQPPPFKVRDGFEITLAAAPPLLKYPMMACLDDMGNLYVAESDGRNFTTREEIENELPRFIRRLTDTDGDGIFDRSTIFADKMTMPEGGPWHDGALYIVSAPYLWRLEDTDNDGRPDKRKNRYHQYDADSEGNFSPEALGIMSSLRIRALSDRKAHTGIEELCESIVKQGDARTPDVSPPKRCHPGHKQSCVSRPDTIQL